MPRSSLLGAPLGPLSLLSSELGDGRRGLEWIDLSLGSSRVRSRGHPGLFEAQAWLLCFLADLFVGIEG